MAVIRVETKKTFILTLNEKEAELLKGYLQNVTPNSPNDVADVVCDVYEKLNNSLSKFNPFE